MKDVAADARPSRRHRPWVMDSFPAIAGYQTSEIAAAVLQHSLLTTRQPSVIVPLDYG
jgi:hypothetical protein